ncbi:hypothetical protein BGX28_003529 [Mortierella sp. GBA30]|nr:hypothetical protein BGX28_003529 [Mortierella sp. GBA30]
MNLTIALRSLRVFIILLTVAITCNNIYFPPTTPYDHINTLLAPTFTVAYSIALCAKVSFVGPYLRAALMILPALLWYSSSMSRPDNVSDDTDLVGPLIRMDTFISFPASILIVLESILTLRWEARRKRLAEAAKVVHGHAQELQPQLQPGLERELTAVSNGPLIPTVLQPEEQDHVEVVIPPPNALVQTPQSNLKAEQAPVPAYFSLSLESASASSSIHVDAENQRQRLRTDGGESGDRASSTGTECEEPPPYTRL